MNSSTALGRKLIYLVILVAMLVPLYMLGQPSAGGGDLGGRLTEMRTDFNIAESDLGEISPASETMKLASLGLRGVAATLLWNKAHEYQITHEWDRLKAALNNIALLQPHYDKVWEHQAHNLSYNVSIQFDDYRQRYAMVREGAEFLTRGVRQNQRAPRLIWYLGWFYGQKMGKSDEKKQYRRLFADDEVLHQSLLDEEIDVKEAGGPNGKPDNWLVGRLWLNRGYDLVDAGVKIRRQTPLNFYETGPKSRMHHAEAIESEGYLYDGAAENAWELAEEDWKGFGERPILATNAMTIMLGEYDKLQQDRAIAIEEFRATVGTAYDDAISERLKDSPDLMDVWKKAPEDRSDIGKEAIERVELELLPKLGDIAKKSDPSVRLRAINLVSEIAQMAEQIKRTNGYRDQINYEYWLTLAQAEQEPRTVRARRLVYEAEKANADAELDKAIALYEEAFGVWAEIFEDYPILTIDDSADDLYDSIRNYMIAVDSEDLAEDFPLFTFTSMMRQNGSVDSRLYAEYSKTQKAKAKARREELKEEERQREQEAEAAANNKGADKEEKPDMTLEKPEAPKEEEADKEAANSEKKEVENAEAEKGDDEASKAKDDAKPESDPELESPKQNTETPEKNADGESEGDSDTQESNNSVENDE